MIESETYKLIYTGDGSTTVFPYTFKIFADADLKVTKYTIADASQEVLVLNTDYTVSGAGDASGGNVTTTDTLSSDYKLIIQRDLDYTQETDYVENDNFPAQTHENALDKLTMLVLQLKEQMDRAVVRDATASSQVEFPEDYNWTDEYPATSAFGLDANKPASPEKGEVYIATDTEKYYICNTAGAWTEHLPSIDEDDMSSDSGSHCPTQQSVKTYVDNQISAEVMPSGVIVLWSGAIANIPSGYVICDGNNSTPNLTGKFVVHADADSGGTYDVGGTGGENTHTLTTDEMPSHTHTQNSHSHTQRRYNAGVPNSYSPTIVSGDATPVSWGPSTGSTTATNQNTGGGSAHENRPPYYALAFIMKT